MIDTATHPQVPFEVLAEQVLALLAQGATLGDMLEFDERDYEVIYRLGHTLYMQRRFADAVKVFGFLVAHNHLERRYTKAFASALQMTGDYTNAIRLYTLASVMDMTDPTPCFHTCECLMALGMKSEAAEGLRMVVRQCREESRTELRERAQAMLSLLDQPASTAGDKDIS